MEMTTFRQELVDTLEYRLELYFTLRLAGLECLSQFTPDPVEPGVAHLEESPNIGGALLVEERRRLGAVAIAAVGPLPFALEEAQCDQGVEEVVYGARVQREPRTDFLARDRLGA